MSDLFQHLSAACGHAITDASDMEAEYRALREWAEGEYGEMLRAGRSAARQAQKHGVAPDAVTRFREGATALDISRGQYHAARATQAVADAAARETQYNTRRFAKYLLAILTGRYDFGVCDGSVPSGDGKQGELIRAACALRSANTSAMEKARAENAAAAAHRADYDTRMTAYYNAMPDWWWRGNKHRAAVWNARSFQQRKDTYVGARKEFQG
ncbi:MAG: hypothetical protein JNM98_21620 [Rhodocyclaceae bacterium]|nr:hypothetical protein [Rhodocyclaceae bacterium]